MVKGDVFQYASLPPALGDCNAVICATGARDPSYPLGPFEVIVHFARDVDLLSCVVPAIGPPTRRADQTKQVVPPAILFWMEVDGGVVWGCYVDGSGLCNGKQFWNAGVWLLPAAGGCGFSCSPCFYVGCAACHGCSMLVV